MGRHKCGSVEKNKQKKHAISLVNNKDIFSHSRDLWRVDKNFKQIS